MTKLTLLPIGVDATVKEIDDDLCDNSKSVVQAMATLYGDNGFFPPWIGYLAVVEATVRGTCGFKGPPQSGVVEIAYFTFPEYQGCGLATAMAAHLVTQAKRAMPGVVITAQTLPQRNASHRVLEKLSFAIIETRQHPDDGTVLLWQHSGGTTTDQESDFDELD